MIIDGLTNKLATTTTQIYNVCVCVGNVFPKGLPSYDQLSPLYLFSTLNITHVIKLPRLSTRNLVRSKLINYYFVYRIDILGPRLCMYCI